VGVPANARAAADVHTERHVLRRFYRKTRVRMRDALRLSGRAGGVKNDQRIFGGGEFGGRNFLWTILKKNTFNQKMIENRSPILGNPLVRRPRDSAGCFASDDNNILYSWARIRRGLRDCESVEVFSAPLKTLY